MPRTPEQQEVFDRLACGLGRRDELPNKELGQDVAARRAVEEVAVLVQLLSDPQADSSAIKALYECGYLAPELLVPHVDSFVLLLDHKKNRLVWGGMIALLCVTEADADVMWPHHKRVQAAFESGSTITRDAAVKALARLAASSSQRADALTQWFVRALSECRPKDVASWSEDIMPSLSSNSRDEVRSALRARIDEAPTKTARSRIERLLDG